MKCLTIQLDLSLDRSRDLDSVLSHIRSIGRYPELDRLDAHSEQVALNFFTEDLALLWHELESKLFADGEFGGWLKSVAVVGCEGEEGWSDARLLYHYDAGEHLDGLGA